MLRRKERAPKRASSAPTYDELTYVLLYLPKVPIFSGCSQEQLARVSGLATVRNLDDGEVVVREGEPGDEFYVVLTGGATVTRGGDVVAKLQPGAFFGELALFDPAPRNATVTASGASSVAVLTRDAFRVVLAEPPVRDAVITGMARRLHELDGKV